jgi:hypothetical protein
MGAILLGAAPAVERRQALATCAFTADSPAGLPSDGSRMLPRRAMRTPRAVGALVALAVIGILPTLQKAGAKE